LITDQVVTILSNGQAFTPAELVGHVPDLAGQPNSANVPALVLRLDCRFREHEGHWLLREGVIDPSQQFARRCKLIFRFNPKGELLKHLIPAVATQTGQPTMKSKK